MRGWGSSGGQRRSGHRPGVSASGARLGLGQAVLARAATASPEARAGCTAPIRPYQR
jgi:hypothetical protein